MILGEFGVTSRPSESADYLEQFNENTDDSGDSNSNDTSSQARLVIIATAITGGLLIIVVAAILCKLTTFLIITMKGTKKLKLLHPRFIVLILNSRKKKENRTPSGSTRSVLTFSNPNYNGADGNLAPVEPKVTIWKRLKYDKAQVSLTNTNTLSELNG